MRSVMTIFLLGAIGLTAGCAGPPKPKNCEGDFRPINAATQQRASISAGEGLALCTKGQPA